MSQPNSPKSPQPKPDTLANPQNEKEVDELTEEDLESINGGTNPVLFKATATGKHIVKGTITVR